MSSPSTSQLKPSILKALRKATVLSIGIDARDIILIPHTLIKGAGGRIEMVAGTPRAAQRFNIAPVSATLKGMASISGGATQAQGGAWGNEWAYLLTGTWDSVIEKNDSWVDGDITYRVMAINPFNGYEKTAMVSGFGARPNYGS